MASVYDLKPRFQSLLRSQVVRCAKNGITANQITLVALLLSFSTGAFLAKYCAHSAVLLVLAPVLFIRMALNAMDGMLAREHNMKSALGAILNELGDVASDSALYLPLALYEGFAPGVIVFIVILSIISEMTGVVAIQIGASRRYDGPMGKSDRAFVFGAITFLTGLGILPVAWIPSLLWIIVLLLCLTIVNRSKKALAEVQNQYDR